MRRRARLAAGFVLAVLAAVVYPLDPRGAGGLVFTSAAALFIVVIILGPLRRGVRPLRIWLVQTLGSVFLLLSLFATALNPSLGPLRYSDITYFSGYACLVVWLALLSRRVGGRADPTAFLDTAAVCSGAALAIWTVAVARCSGTRSCRPLSCGRSTRRSTPCCWRWPGTWPTGWAPRCPR